MPSNGASLAPHPTPAAWRPLAAAVGLAVLGVLLIAWGRDLSILRRAPLLIGIALSFIALAIGGFRASLMVFLPCTAAGVYFLLDPVGSFAIADPLERVRTVVSIVLTIGVAGLVAWQRVDRRRLRTRERAHRESEERYRALMDQASDGIFVSDEAGVLTTVNQRACEMLGYGRDELVGTDVRRLISPESLRAVPLRVDELKERPLVLAEREMVRKDGSRFFVEVSARLMTDGRTQAIVRDVTERRAAERSMRQLEARLQHSQRLEALGRLAGGVAHDFNNLLTVIIGNAQIISDSIEDGPTRERAREIHSASERAASLTQQLLAFGRKQAMQFSDVDLNEVVRGFASIARRLAGDVPLELDLDPNVGRVRADVVQLEQVLLNLVVNARDALVGEGTIRVRTRLESAHTPGDDVVEDDPRPRVVLTVEDDGIGMDAVTQSQMFEPFFTTKPGRGSGLGLSTVYGIVRQSGGYVRVDSAPGRGTSVHVSLPALAAEPGAEQPPERGRAVPPSSRLVLLVDDEGPVRAVVRRMLEQLGLDVVEAVDGDHALRLAEGLPPPALLVTDVLMEGVAGRELADTLTRRWPELRVLYLSGYVHEDLALDDKAPRGRGFLHKPFTIDQLAAAVARLESLPPVESPPAPTAGG